VPNAPYTSNDAAAGAFAGARRIAQAPRGLRVTFGVVFVLSLLVRLILAGAATPAFVSDARDYRDLADNLAAGRGYTQVYQGETGAFNGFTFRAFRPPGYPAFLVALHAISGHSDYAYLFANILADLATQVCFLLIAAQVLGAWPALLVQILLAAHVLWTPNPMTESLHTALFAVLALLLVAKWPLRSWIGALVFGLIAAAALFVRPVTVCVFPALVWQFAWHEWSAFHARRRQTATVPRPSKPRSPASAPKSPPRGRAPDDRHTIAQPPRGVILMRSLLLLILAVLPSAISTSLWAARNHRLFGETVWFTTNFGHHNAWDYGFHADNEFARLRAAGLNEAQINRELTRLERERALTYPVAWLITCAQRAADLFSLDPPVEVNDILWKLILNADTSSIGRLFRVSYRQYEWTYSLAACGVLLLALWRRGLSGLWSLFLSYVVVHAVLSRGDIRLLAPAYPIMCVFAAGVWMVLQDLWSRRERSINKGM
jgi:hypothetical protein